MGIIGDLRFIVEQARISERNGVRDSQRLGIWVVLPWVVILGCAALWGWWLDHWVGWLLGSLPGLPLGALCAQLRCTYSYLRLHPGDIHGHNRTDEEFKGLRETGFTHEVAMRHFPIFLPFKFVYGSEASRPRTAFVATCVLTLVGLFTWTAVTLALLLTAASVFLFAVGDFFPPRCMYLGSSTADSHRFLKRLKHVSQGRWASLLMGPPPPAGQDALLHAMDTQDPWSLRSPTGEGWRDTVQVYLKWGTLIVLRASESTPFVEEELSMVAARYMPSVENSLRQFVVACQSTEIAEQLLERYPVLEGRLLSEEEALNLVADVFLHPVRTRKRLAEPLHSSLFVAPVPAA